MVQEKEKLWLYEAVEPGQQGRPSVVTLTPEDIARYALVSQNHDLRYQASPVIPMPTMVLTYAPLMREDIADANGFTALERSTTARRQTPFAKCEVWWWAPVKAGDTLTGNRKVFEKYERRGNRFVTFSVDAANQDGVAVARYDYTCIFDYAQGQREVPQELGTAAPTLEPHTPPSATPAAKEYPSFESLEAGDLLPPLSLSESQEIINRKNDFRMFGPPSESNIHTDPEFAREGLFGGTVNSGPATLSYVDQTLEQSFPLSAFYNGGRLLMRAIEPFRAGDTVTFQAEITNKTIEASQKIVECRVRGVNQRGDLVSLSDARLVLGESIGT
jgi:acyl dehydratase